MPERKEWTLEIAGMTCEHCARTIDDALRRVPGVVGSDTRLEDHRSRVVTEPDVDAAALAGAIAAKGYQVVNQRSRPLAPEPRSTAADFDLLVIGGGSAGFAASISAAELEARVAIVE